MADATELSSSEHRGLDTRIPNYSFDGFYGNRPLAGKVKWSDAQKTNKHVLISRADVQNIVIPERRRVRDDMADDVKTLKRVRFGVWRTSGSEDKRRTSDRQGENRQEVAVQIAPSRADPFQHGPILALELVLRIVIPGMLGSVPHRAAELNFCKSEAVAQRIRGFRQALQLFAASRVE